MSQGQTTEAARIIGPGPGDLPASIATVKKTGNAGVQIVKDPDLLSALSKISVQLEELKNILLIKLS